MEFRNASEFRAQAEKCLRRSQLTDDRAAKLHWLSLAEAWLVLSENLGKGIFKERIGDVPEPHSTPHHDTRH